MTFSEICERFEKKGALELAVSKKFRKALFTDFTQQTLFAAEGLYLAEKAEGMRKKLTLPAMCFMPSNNGCIPKQEMLRTIPTLGFSARKPARMSQSWLHKKGFIRYVPSTTKVFMP